MADEIKAIETYYNGYRFRSRLEARWAVFFDALGIAYEYEPEGFTVNEECYLPDFYLPGFDIYAEVKPDTDKGIFEVDKKYPDFLTWGGKIKALLILSDLPGSRFYEDALLGDWCFPILYYHGFGCKRGWWRFYIDYYSRSDDGKTYNYDVNGCLTLFDCFNMADTIKAQSDTLLVYRRAQRSNDKITMDRIEESLKQKKPIGWDQNEILEALSIAKKARFEHGETPKPEAIAIWRKNGCKKPENYNSGC